MFGLAQFALNLPLNHPLNRDFHVVPGSRFQGAMRCGLSRSQDAALYTCSHLVSAYAFWTRFSLRFDRGNGMHACAFAPHLALFAFSVGLIVRALSF